MLREAIDELKAVAEGVIVLDAQLRSATHLLVDRLTAGGKLLACGNGGSAAEAQHFVTELVGRYKSSRRALPAIWLGGDTSQMTCISNDFSPDEIFSRPLSALSDPSRDVLVALSTSGQSPSIVRCLERARELGVPSIALLGKDGGICANLATIPLVVPSQSTARIQEMHLMMVHLICDAIEEHCAAA